MTAANGDEFTVLCPGVTDPDALSFRAERLVQAADGALYQAEREAWGSWRVAGQ
ncbi:MAG TPA: hypothetical protein VIJ47_09340 [Acidimicrobiales bacterium]